ncbi:MAG: WecB/TagA/CpsF family glycosyltransferase [Pseudomonadota bacterium]
MEKSYVVDGVAPVKILGVPVHPMTMARVLDLVHDAISKRRKLQIGVVNAAKVVNMHRDPALGEDVLSSDLILADGQAIVWASRILGTPLPERIAGIDLMFEMFKRGQQHGYRVYCLGATEEISAKVAERLAAGYPGVVLAGRQNGYFSQDEEERVAADIAASRADILLVAMTSPKKENFLARWSQTMGVPVCHGVGGSFDVMAGKVLRAPPLWQRLGLEWLYRVKQEPRRLWRRYFVTNTLFCWMTFKAWLQRLRSREAKA